MEESRRRKSVRVNILLDYCRGNRTNDRGESSGTILRRLLRNDEASSSECRIAMYHTPILRGLWKMVMPQRYNETLGLQHTKIYLFDDTLILSGANLSEDYFTNR